MSSLVDDTKIRCSCSARELRSGSAGVSLRKECAVPVVVSDSTCGPGQVSSYKARPGGRSSTVTILRVETLPKAGVIVHVRIDGVGSRTAQECPRLPPCNMLFLPKRQSTRAWIDNSERLLQYQSSRMITRAGSNIVGVLTPLTVAEVVGRGRHYVQRWLGLPEVNLACPQPGSAVTQRSSNDLIQPQSVGEHAVHRQKTGAIERNEARHVS
jgi:hypothetical protein